MSRVVGRRQRRPVAERRAAGLIRHVGLSSVKATWPTPWPGKKMLGQPVRLAPTEKLAQQTAACGFFQTFGVVYCKQVVIAAKIVKTRTIAARENIADCYRSHRTTGPANIRPAPRRYVATRSSSYSKPIRSGIRNLPLLLPGGRQPRQCSFEQVDDIRCWRAILRPCHRFQPLGKRGRQQQGKAQLAAGGFL